MFILALVLFDGAAVAWALWEFWSVRPKRTAKADDPRARSEPSPEDSGHPERQHRAHDR
jgi:hypothetical protein